MSAAALAAEPGTHEAPVTLREMRSVADGEAFRIEITQEALVDAQMRPAADRGQMRRAAVFRGIVRLIDLINTDPKILDRLKAAAPAKAGSA